VLDEGHLTDNYGRVIDFKNTVVIMTSNVGAKDITRGRSLGFGADSDQADFDRISEKVKEEMGRVFNPEFLNRLDDVIVFHPLRKEHIAQIVSILFRDVQKRLDEEEIKISLTQAATDFLVEQGTDEHFGARPLKRAIQRYIEDPLSEKLLLREFSKGDEIEVDVGPEKGKLEFRVMTPTTPS
jgi:ATP-dependent Clp protease ATP-binding subunit ClpC